MAEGQPEHPTDADQVVSSLRERVEQERAAGAYADDLSAFELETPSADEAAGTRVRFRPELGFSSKPVIGRPITYVKRLLLRLQFYVFDDLAKQADEAIARVEQKLAVEVANRERLATRIAELEETLRRHEEPQRRAK
jgi:hypothetical protein